MACPGVGVTDDNLLSTPFFRPPGTGSGSGTGTVCAMCVRRRERERQVTLLFDVRTDLLFRSPCLRPSVDHTSGEITCVAGSREVRGG